MLTNKEIQYMLNSLMDEIQLEADITDLDSKVIASTSKARIGLKDKNFPKQISDSDKNTIMHEGRVYAAIHSRNRSKYYLILQGSDRTCKNFAILIAKFIEANLSLINKKLSREDSLHKILSGDISGFEIEEAISEHKLDSELPRCVFVIRTPKLLGDKAYEVISEAFSNNRLDFLVRMDNRTIALIKAVNDDTECEDFAQLAGAIFETVFSETSIKTVVGVGSLKLSINSLRNSYIEAHKAIEAGLIFNPGDSVHIYDNLFLERLVSQIPNDVSEAYLKQFFTDEFDKLLNPEMIATIGHLFDNNLNLSEASRRLYIHRNTLVYRLDKIKKSVGLDLRNFHDAVTFRLMIMLKMRR